MALTNQGQRQDPPYQKKSGSTGHRTRRPIRMLLGASCGTVLILRNYWKAARPKEWLFPGVPDDRPITKDAVQAACQKARRLSGLSKPVTLHSLRHYLPRRTMSSSSDHEGKYLKNKESFPRNTRATRHSRLDLQAVQDTTTVQDSRYCRSLSGRTICRGPRAFLAAGKRGRVFPLDAEANCLGVLTTAKAVQSQGGSISSTRLRSLLGFGEDWLCSIGALLPDDVQPPRFAWELGAFTEYMCVERGLSPVAIATREERMRWFFASLPSRVRSLGRTFTQNQLSR
jgi:hypothetical protein